MTKILILNGPPQCGKDTAANAIEAFFGNDVCKHLKLSWPLKYIASSVFGKSIPSLEAHKNYPIHNDLSYRDAQIHIFNQLVPVFGEDWLGQWLMNELESFDQEYFVLSDGGRAGDIRPFTKNLPAKDLQIIQIMREGCTFFGDIRSYITASNIRTRPIVNKDIEAFKLEVIDYASEFFAGG